MASGVGGGYGPAMLKGRNHGLLIAGGGVSGSLAALAMARLRPEVPLMLVEEGEDFAGARSLWSYHSASP